MLSYFERRARENDDGNAQSQDSLSSHCDKTRTNDRPLFDKMHQKYTERDAVLQLLLERPEENKAATASSGKKTWVSSKWFASEKSASLNPDKLDLLWQ